MTKQDNIPDIRPDWDMPNYNKGNIAPYTLEDPLTFLDGSKVKTPDDWKRRRKEILDIFASEMYGQEPPKPDKVFIDLMDEKDGAVAGFAVRSQFRMTFREDRTGPAIDWMLIRPKYSRKKAPVIIFLNYRGNFEMLTDPDIPLNHNWMMHGNFVEGCHVTEKARGKANDPNSNSILPINVLIAKGYAVLTACYADISPDPEWNIEDPACKQDPFAYTGIFELWGKRDESRTDNTTALGAWAWALSRGLDLAEQITELDAKKAVVTGCSRLGKAAFLAAARDERFPVCVPNQCGGGGICLAKRDFGECVGTEMRMFTHWYCKAYAKYQRNPARLLTFDQHLLLAAIAPRRVLVEGFRGDDWMDTEGEYLACKAASPAWQLFGLPAFPNHAFPDFYDTACIGPYIGYVRRTEGHGISAHDWLWLMDFAEALD